VWTFSHLLEPAGKWPDLPLCADAGYAYIQQFEFRFEIARFPHRLQAWQFSTRFLVLGLDKEVVQLGHLPAHAFDQPKVTCGTEAADARQKLFQILCELVLIEEFLVFVIRFSEKTYYPLIFLKELGDLVVLRRRLRAWAISEQCGLDRIKGEGLTR
jgi:hypothetical protein